MSSPRPTSSRSPLLPGTVAHQKRLPTSLLWAGLALLSLLLMAVLAPVILPTSRRSHGMLGGEVAEASETRNRSSSPLRWGIAGLGLIANDFAAVLTNEGHKLNAVAANYLPFPKQRAMIFAMKFHVPRYYGSYVELAEDRDIDIVYIANTHAMHFASAMLMLSHGKHVLVEKPTTMSYNDTRRLIEYAHDQVNLALKSLYS